MGCEPGLVWQGCCGRVGLDAIAVRIVEACCGMAVVVDLVALGSR